MYSSLVTFADRMLIGAYNLMLCPIHVLRPFIVSAIWGATPPAAAKGKDGKPVKLTVGQKFASEPILFPLMVVYNASQVALCGWMVYGAVAEYIAKDYVPVCNK